MAEPPPFPWLYPHQEDGPRLDRVVLRPIVPVALVGPLGISSTALALVDSGCSHVLVAPWLAVDIGDDPKASDLTLNIGIGGETVGVRFTPLTMRLYAPDAGDETYVEWEDLVGFLDHWRPTWPVVLGQDAFMKRFTVTMSRHAQCVALEDHDAFDSRFPPTQDR